MEEILKTGIGTTAEYDPEYGKDYDIVNNPDKFQSIDGKEIK